MSDLADAAVIGAGVVGLAVARALARAGREVTVLETERSIGVHTSSRNSEVIHAGIYYPPGSLRARLCVEGRQALYAYCAARGVPHARLGKLIVATADEEVPALERLRATAEANDVRDLAVLSSAEARALEPEVRCVRALHSPSTGIVDSHALMAALRADAEAAGAMIALATPVLSGRVADGIELETGGAEPVRTRFRLVVNCAGPWAPEVAGKIEGIPRASIPPQFFAKGHYFMLSGPSPFRRLVYPLPPASGGLGTHVTLDLAGRARFGPDLQWCDRVEYSFDESRAQGFYDSIRRYYPALKDGALQPGFTGVRPRIAPPGSPPADFMVQGPSAHGVPGLVNLYGIESPGLTAALALAEHVRRIAAS